MRKNINLYQKYALKIDKFKKKNRGMQFGCVARKSRTQFILNNDIRTQFRNTGIKILLQCNYFTLILIYFTKN
jgi:hypothetical protein